MLKTENRNNGKKAFKAFMSSNEPSLHVCPDDEPAYYDWTFEHGQLWITCVCGHAWSVVDANTDSGFDFEEV